MAKATSKEGPPPCCTPMGEVCSATPNVTKCHPQRIGGDEGWGKCRHRWVTTGEVLQQEKERHAWGCREVNHTARHASRKHKAVFEGRAGRHGGRKLKMAWQAYGGRCAQGTMYGPAPPYVATTVKGNEREHGKAMAARRERHTNEHPI